MTALEQRPIAATDPRPTAARSEHRKSFRHDIEGLRGIAVLLIVLYHAGVPFLTGGYVGVDVFFVISGFLITALLLRTKPSLRALQDFSARRIRRLLPAAVLVVGLTVIVARFAGPVLESSSTAKDALAVATLLVNYHFAGEGLDYLAQTGAPSPFLHFWSLAVEEQFYILWPALLLGLVFLMRGASDTATRVLIGVVTALSVIASYWASVTLTTSDAPLAYYSLQSRAWELGTGVLLAVAAPLLERTPRLLRSIVTWSGLALIIGSAFVLDDATRFPGSIAAVPVAGAALIIAGGIRRAPEAAVRTAGGGFLARRWLRFVGSVSYTWYLWHWPVLVLAPALFHRDFGLGERLAMLVLSFWFAVLTSLLVERPLIGRRGASVPWFRVGLAAAAIVGLVAGSAVLLPPSIPGVTAVAAARSGNATSGPVTPSVLDAKNDTPSYPARCIRNFTQSDVPSCNITRNGSDRGRAIAGRVVLLGDSHAGQWYPVARDVADARNTDVEVINKVGCPLATMTVVNSTLKRNYDECDDWRRSVLERLVSEPEPSVIFMSSLKTYRSADGTSTPAAWKRTLDALEAVGAPIVYLADTPHPSKDIPACVADHVDDWTSCAFPRDAAMPTDDLRDTINATHPRNTTVIDVNDALCPAGSDCPAVIGGTLLYRDASHLTDTAARSLVPAVGSALRHDSLTRSLVTDDR